MIKNIAGLASKTTKTSQSSNYNFIWEGLFFITAVLEHKTTRLENGEKCGIIQTKVILTKSYDELFYQTESDIRTGLGQLVSLEFLK